MTKDVNELYQSVRASIFPQLEDDLMMTARKYSVEEFECVLELIHALNSGAKVHAIDRTHFDALDFPKQREVSFDVLNLARVNGGRFYRAFDPMYVLFDMQEGVWNEGYINDDPKGHLAQKNLEKEQIDKMIARIEERNKGFESELDNNK